MECRFSFVRRGSKVRQNALPVVLKRATTVDGFAFEVRHDAVGVLEVPGLDSVLIGIHIGAPTKLSCHRDGRRYTGTAVHGDIDIIPAGTPSRWEMHDENDRSLLLILPQTLLRSVAGQSGLDAARVEIRNRFQVRDLVRYRRCSDIEPALSRERIQINRCRLV
jgi:AraC family transcriptional regulator